MRPAKGGDHILGLRVLDMHVDSPDFFRDPRRGCAPGKVNPDIFFNDYFVEQAKNVCNGCPFKSRCAAWAVANNERWGVWGGRRRRGRPRVDREAA